MSSWKVTDVASDANAVAAEVHNAKEIVESARSLFLKENDSENIKLLIAEQEQALSRCTARWQMHARIEAQSAIAQLKTKLERVLNGEALRDWDANAAPFLAAHKKCKAPRKKKAATEEPAVVVRRDKSDARSLRDEAQHALTSTAPSVVLVDDTDACPKCGEAMRVSTSEALLGCSQCGLTKAYVQSTASTRAYRDDGPPEFAGGFSKYFYRRGNHMAGWIALVQGKESMQVPDDVYTLLIEQFRKERVMNADDITPKRVREVLKILKLRKYYDNVAQITARLTGKPPPRLTPSQETECIAMFQSVEQVWAQHCPADRRNFLSYSYCLYKFCQLRGWDYLLTNFSLLKGRDKLQRQDAIWKKICQSLDWEYFASV